MGLLKSNIISGQAFVQAFKPTGQSTENEFILTFSSLTQIQHRRSLQLGGQHFPQKQNSCIHDMAGRRALMRNISAPTPPTTRVKEQLRPLTSSTHQHSFQTTLLSFKKRSVSMTMCTKCKGTRVQRHKHSKAVMSSSTS